MLKVFAIESGEEISTISCQGYVMDTTFSPCSEMIASAEAGGLCRIWEVENGTELFRWEAEEELVVSLVTWSPDGRLLAFATWDGRLRVVDVQTKEVIHIWISDQGRVWNMLWQPGGHVLATAGARNGVRYWSAEQGKLLRQEDASLHELSRHETRLGPARCTSVSPQFRDIAPDGRRLIADVGGSVAAIQNIQSEEIELFLCPLSGSNWLAINARNGHLTGEYSPTETPVYVVQVGERQENLAPDEFAARFGWQNQPDLVRPRPHPGE